jgi:hypothetical protein
MGLGFTIRETVDNQTDYDFETSTELQICILSYDISGFHIEVTEIFALFGVFASNQLVVMHIRNSL